MKRIKSLLVWLLLLSVFFLMWGGVRTQQVKHIEFERFVEEAEDDVFSEIWINGSYLEGNTGREIYASVGELTNELVQGLLSRGVDVKWETRKTGTTVFLELFLTVLPLMLVLAGLAYFFNRGAKGGTGNILGLRRSTARELPAKRSVTFSDVGGCVEAKEQLQDVVDFLKDPARWTGAGARPPRGILLEGPPGCGKTLLARAISGETKAAFFVVSASEFVEMFIGVGAARVRDLFEQAAKKAPSVIFIDELDAMGRKRGSGVGSANDEREQTLNQLLVSMDGFQNDTRVVVVAATNRPDVLDRALLRPGRFDRRIKIPPLSNADRLEILRIHTRAKRLDASVSLEALSERTSGMTGSDIEALANEAALRSLRRSRGNGAPVTVTNDDFDAALRPLESEMRRFNYLDLVLIESASQLTEPAGKALARVTTKTGDVFEGEVVWCDAAFIKLNGAGAPEGQLVPKRQIKKIEALPGTEYARNDELAPDRWAGHTPEVA